MEKQTTQRPAPSQYTMFWDCRQKKWYFIRTCSSTCTVALNIVAFARVYESRPTQIPSKWVDPRELQRQSRPQKEIRTSEGGLPTPPLTARSRTSSSPRIPTPSIAQPVKSITDVRRRPLKEPQSAMTPPATPPATLSHLPNRKTQSLKTRPSAPLDSNFTRRLVANNSQRIHDSDDEEAVTIQVEADDGTEISLMPDPNNRRVGPQGPLHENERPKSVSDVAEFLNDDASSLFIGLHSKHFAAMAPAHLFKSRSVENLNKLDPPRLRINTDVTSILESQRIPSTFNYERYRARQEENPISIPLTSPVVMIPASLEKQGLTAQVRSKLQIPGFKKRS